MTPNHRRTRTIRSLVTALFRLSYRAVLWLLTLLVLGACYAVGGVPRIERPERKNPMASVEPD